MDSAPSCPDTALEAGAYVSREAKSPLCASSNNDVEVTSAFPRGNQAVPCHEERGVKVLNPELRIEEGRLALRSAEGGQPCEQLGRRENSQRREEVSFAKHTHMYTQAPTQAHRHLHKCTVGTSQARTRTRTRQRHAHTPGAVPHARLLTRSRAHTTHAARSDHHPLSKK